MKYSAGRFRLILDGVPTKRDHSHNNRKSALYLQKQMSPEKFAKEINRFLNLRLR